MSARVHTRKKGHGGLRLLAGIARVVGLFVALGLFAGWSFVRSASAAIEDVSALWEAELAVGREARLHSAPRRLSVNGLELRFVTASFDEEIDVVLDRLQGSCRSSGGLRLAPAGSESASHVDTSLRRESAAEGFLACLDTGGPLELGQLTARLQRFLETGDLRDVGVLRTVRARREGRRTTILGFWTEGSAPLARLFPEGGDAPGRDLEDFPRPPGSRRVLSAFEEGEPYSLQVYRASGKEEPLSWYRRALEEQGWAVRELPRGALLVTRSGRTLLVRARPRKAGTEQSWIVAELAAPSNG